MCVIDLNITCDSSTRDNLNVPSGLHRLTDLSGHMHGIVIEDVYVGKSFGVKMLNLFSSWLMVPDMVSSR